MTDDIDWKARCRKVAEWLGECEPHLENAKGFERHTDKIKKHGSRLYELNELTGEPEFDRYGYPDTTRSPMYNYDTWPDYTRDDAAAWRLLVSLPAWWAMMRGMSLYEVGPVEYGQGLLTKAEHEYPKKALVLAACHLIDKGEDPRSDR